MDSPSPIMSMLRSILWSLCSFLLRPSRAWDVRSLGAGFSTFPLHSTFENSNDTAVSFCSQSKHAVHLLTQHDRSCLCKVYLHCQSRWFPLFVWAQGTSRSICHSWIYQRRWTQSHMFQLPRLQSGHLMKQRWKIKNARITESIFIRKHDWDL